MASSKGESATSAPIPQPAPLPISTQTVALMIQLCEYMFSPRRPFREPLWDITKLSTVLFGMGFGQDFLLCESEYYWNFATLFPALHDGSFYQLGSYGQSRGQGDLRGF